jgi:nicotinamidase-related amidase
VRYVGQVGNNAFRKAAFATASIDGIALRNNVAIVANAAKAFAVSTILTTVSAESFSGPIFDEVRSALPSLRIIDRTSMNCWEDAAVVAEINRIGKSRIVIAGLWTSVCVADPVLSALDQDFDVYVIADACGDVSEEAYQRAIERMLQVGARPMTACNTCLSCSATGRAPGPPERPRVSFFPTAAPTASA